MLQHVKINVSYVLFLAEVSKHHCYVAANVVSTRDYIINLLLRNASQSTHSTTY